MLRLISNTWWFSMHKGYKTYAPEDDKLVYFVKTGAQRSLHVT